MFTDCWAKKHAKILFFYHHPIYYFFNFQFSPQLISGFIYYSYLCSVITKSPDGGIGRRAGLKHQWIHFHAGSTPALGTK